MGVPSVRPSKVPERIWQVSLSLRGVTILLWPGPAAIEIDLDVGLGQRGCAAGSRQPQRRRRPPWDSPHVVI